MEEKTTQTQLIRSTIRNIWKPSFVAWGKFCDAAGLSDATLTYLGPCLENAREQVLAEYDLYADLLGRSFAYGDAKAKYDLGKAAEVNLNPLIDAIRQNMHTTSNEWERAACNLAESASHMMMQVLQEYVLRLGGALSNSANFGSSRQPQTADEKEIPYCDGAFLLQGESTDISTILSWREEYHCYVCNICFLEISDYGSKAQEYGPEDWLTLSRCHIMACSSLSDRRAAYRCLYCSHIETSAPVFLEHLRTRECLVDFDAIIAEEMYAESLRTNKVDPETGGTRPRTPSKPVPSMVINDSPLSQPPTQVLPQRPIPVNPALETTPMLPARPGSRNDAQNTRRSERLSPHVAPHQSRLSGDGHPQSSSHSSPGPGFDEGPFPMNRNNSSSRVRASSTSPSPLPPPPPPPPPIDVTEDNINKLIEYGSTREEAISLLQRMGNRLDFAADLLFQERDMVS